MSWSFDIFCKVVDNYGDIGVCWRLARQLSAHTDCAGVRLWVDDLQSFARIAPGVNPSVPKQTVAGIVIVHWKESAELTSAMPEPADVVIEAFACTLPAAYVQKMTGRQLWINLEYLSAEGWVESCHALPSPQAGGLRKYFFFPGFTPATGGLLREPDLLSRRDAWQADPHARLSLLSELGVDTDWLQRVQAGARLVYVYCYPQAPLPELLQALASHNHETLVLMPRGVWPGTLPSTQHLNTHVAIHTHDFVDQERFDQLLWSSDLNVVRGEDSLLRAIWAGRAMIWQPYPQQDDAHLQKLDAWLRLSPYSAAIQTVMQAWSGADSTTLNAALPSLLTEQQLAQWSRLTRSWCVELATEVDLVSRLLQFCASHSQTG